MTQLDIWRADIDAQSNCTEPWVFEIAGRRCVAQCNLGDGPWISTSHDICNFMCFYDTLTVICIKQFHRDLSHAAEDRQPPIVCLGFRCETRTHR